MNKNELKAGTAADKLTTADFSTSASLVQNGMLSDAVQEGNKLIAKFMDEYDLFHWERDPFNEFCKADYHYRWDNLMPACKKFIDLYFDVLEIKAHEEHILRCESLNNAVTKYEAKRAFKQLVENIKWYNAQNNKSA